MIHSDPTTERALLGAFMLDENAYFACATLTQDDFSLDTHRRIFTVMSAIHGDGRPVDIITLADSFRKLGQVDAIGGIAYLASLTEGLPRNPHPEQYVPILKEKSRLRKLQGLAERMASQSSGRDASSLEMGAQWSASISQILDGSEDDKPAVRDFIVDELNRIERESHLPEGLNGLSYGVAGLNRLTSGMHPGEVTAVGARSGVGKTSLMIQAAVANCSAGVPCHLFSLEMTRGKIVRRILSIISGIYYFRLRDPRKLRDKDKTKLHEAVDKLAEWPLLIHDRTEMDITQIVRLAQLSIRRHKTKFIGVDYAQIVAGEGDDRKRVSGVSRGITQLIKHEDCSAMLLSQLTKVKPEFYNKEPTIGDLRETGQIENDCHVCALLHRGWGEEQDASGKTTERILSHGRMIVPKQREGDTGVVDVGFDRNFVVFTDREQK